MPQQVLDNDDLVFASDGITKINENFAELYAAATVSAPTFTTKQNNLAASPGGVIAWNGTTTTGITGFDTTDFADGDTLTVRNVTTDYMLWIEVDSTDSSVGNRVKCVDPVILLMPGDRITLEYDATAGGLAVLSWPNRGAGLGLTDWDDFYGTSKFGSTVSGTGAVAGYNSGAIWSDGTNESNGAAYIATGTTTTGYAMLGWYANRQIMCGRGCAATIAKFVVDTATDGTDTYSFYTGFFYTPGTITDAACWEYRWDGAAVEVARLVANNTTVKRGTSSNPTITAGTQKVLAVFCNADWTRVDFIYSNDGRSFALAGSESTNVPGAGRSTGLVLGGVVKSAGTTTRTARVDWGGIRYDAPRVI